MPDPKKRSSISSFSKSQLRLLGTAGLFFLPVVLAFLWVESQVIELPSAFKNIGERIEQKGDQVRVVVFGSSQIMQAVNAEYIRQEALNLSSGAQHHNTDFGLLKGLTERLPALETVVFEVSYSHFEIPHNSKHFWKKPVFYKYYHVNTFDHAVYFKDKLLFPSHPAYYSDRLLEKYTLTVLPYKYNEYGYDLKFYRGKFMRLDYNLDSIMAVPVRMNNREGLAIFKENVNYFKEMLSYANNKGWNIVIISPPTFKNYNALRIPAIVRRRDSVLNQIKTDYPKIQFLNSENDTSFKVTDFRNENHLNPDGAKIFTKKLDSVLQRFSTQN